MGEQYVYIVGSAITSQEGIEGVLGYSPYAVYSSMELAQMAIIEQMKDRFKNKSGVTWEWIADEYDAHTVALHVTYEMARQIWDAPGVRYDTDIYEAVIALPIMTGIEVKSNG